MDLKRKSHRVPDSQINLGPDLFYHNADTFGIKPYGTGALTTPIDEQKRGGGAVSTHGESEGSQSETAEQNASSYMNHHWRSQ